MSKVLTAEYDDATHSLRLLEPLEGIADHERVSVTIAQNEPKKNRGHLENLLKGENGESFAKAIDEAGASKKVPRWSDLRGLLSGEEGEKFARDIEEAFPTEPVRK
jgi:hypothetical protein